MSFDPAYHSTIAINEDHSTTGSSLAHKRAYWFRACWYSKVVDLCAFLSFVSVCMNTSRTFEQYPTLRQVTFAIDIVCLIILTFEMLAKVKEQGLIQRDKAYLRNRWCQFDACMLLFHVISVIIQALEIAAIISPYNCITILRVPRPLILVKVIRSYLNFRMPKSRMKIILQRSSSQIYNVALFFLFFMCLYGLAGVQFFGVLSYHCISTNFEEIRGNNSHRARIEDLMIPDTYCTLDASGYNCPSGTICRKITVQPHQRSYNGFDNLAISLFTVYEAASQEGWVFHMYRAIDSQWSMCPIFYFITMIFFLAWLVKNVFIAVIIETFAEIRVQFQQMWGARVIATEIERAKVLVKTNFEGLKLVDVDDNKRVGAFAVLLHRILVSSVFNTLIILLIVSNIAYMSSLKFHHEIAVDLRERKKFRTVETVFTWIFNAETFLRILSMGFFSYIKHSTHRFQLLLNIGTTIHCSFDPMYRTWLTSFQVLRLVRLLKASPMLEDFANKVFGPGKKLGSLIAFTMILLLITSALSMQLFASIEGLVRFEMFHKAFMSQFQLMMGEEWYSIMEETMDSVESGYLKIMASSIFILQHLAMSTIVLSMFVAVILDNLELDEDVKKIKQLKMREQSAEATQMLPLRLRIFEKFADRPQLVAVSRATEDFITPKIRESFMRRFVDQDESFTFAVDSGFIPPSAFTAAKADQVMNILYSPKEKRAGDAIKRTALSNIVGCSQSLKMLMGDGTGTIGPRSPWTQQATKLGRPDQTMRGVSRRDGATGNAVALKKPPAIRMENGDIVSVQVASASRTNDEYDIKAFQYKKLQAEFKRNQQEDDLRENHPMFDTPLFIVKRDSQFRKFCKTIVDARYRPILKDPITGQDLKVQYKTVRKIIGLVSYLEWVMIAVTSASCTSMMVESPQRRIVTDPLLQIAEYLFVISMSVELMLKVFANGILLTPKAVIKDFGGILDLFIYLVSLMFLCCLPQSVATNSPAQVLMVLRALRPLRIFVLLPDLRKVVFELLRGSKAIILVAVLLFSVLFMFAVYGVHLYGGKLARCNDESIKTREACAGTYLREIDVTKLKLEGSGPKILVPRVWANPHNFNFDNIFSAMLALFEVLSLEGWLEIRDVIISQLGPAHGIFVHVFVFVGSLIGITLFVGVVIANYNENKGTALLTVDQRRWLDLKGRIRLAQPLHMPPRPKNSRFRAFLFDLTQRKIFKKISALLVIGNCLLLVIPWNRDPTTNVTLSSVAVVFTILFLLEALMKTLSLTIKGYWQSRRNCLELLVTLLGIVWMLVNLLNTRFPAIAKVSNIFGYTVIILRLFTVCGKHATLKMLMLTIIASFFKSFFIIIGMFLLMSVYALAGVVLFGCVKYGVQLGRHANFRNSKNALLLLLRIITGEDWNKIMHDCMIEPPFCTPAKNYWNSDCGNVVAAVMYFLSFYVIITYIVLNLLLAIIMENFSLFYSNEEDALLSHTEVRHFQNVWNTVDTARKGSIPSRRAKFLLRLLKGRLEVDMEKDRILFRHMCYEIEKMNNGGDVTFHDVLNMLSCRSVNIRKALQFDELVAREELELLIEEEVAKQTIRTWLCNCIRRMRTKELEAGKAGQFGDITSFYREVATGSAQDAPATAIKRHPTSFEDAGGLGAFKDEKGRARRRVRQSQTGKSTSQIDQASVASMGEIEEIKFEQDQIKVIEPATSTTTSTRDTLSRGKSGHIDTETKENLINWWHQKVFAS